MLLGVGIQESPETLLVSFRKLDCAGNELQNCSQYPGMVDIGRLHVEMLDLGTTPPDLRKQE